MTDIDFLLMFDGIELDGKKLSEVPSLDGLINSIDERAATYAGEGLVKSVIFRDLVKDVLDIEPAELPDKPGHIPTTRSTPKLNTARRKKFREMITAAGIRFNDYTTEALESLISAMERYCDDVIRAAT